MGKLGGLALIGGLTLSGCTANALEAVPVEASEQATAKPAGADKMLVELRPLVQTLGASDADLTRQAFEACRELLLHSADSYRESVLAKYPNDLERGLADLTIAAAAKKYLCP
jgi:hypothetical protein